MLFSNKMIIISAYITSKVFGDFYSFNVKIISTTINFLINFIFTGLQIHILQSFRLAHNLIGALLVLNGVFCFWEDC